MNAPPEDFRPWYVAGVTALIAHAGMAALVLSWPRQIEQLQPEPVVLVELPPQAAIAPAVESAQAAALQPAAAPALPMPRPPIDVAPMAAPQAPDPVILPPPAPAQPVTAQGAVSAPAPAAAPVLATASAATGPVASAAPGSDPRARQQEADYFALVSAHLNRRKTYPVEARRARQQGVVTVRFTVDRQGRVSDVSIRRSSGHELLDSATLDLVQRVAPLPPMPASMPRDRITLSLPIDYSLRTN